MLKQIESDFQRFKRENPEAFKKLKKAGIK